MIQPQRGDTFVAMPIAPIIWLQRSDTFVAHMVTPSFLSQGRHLSIAMILLVAIGITTIINYFFVSGQAPMWLLFGIYRDRPRCGGYLVCIGTGSYSSRSDSTGLIRAALKA